MGFVRCFIYLVIIGLGSNLLMRRLPDSLYRYDRRPYSPAAFEKGGQIYESVGIRHWKDRLPDMSKLLPRLIPLKAVRKDVTAKELELLLKETCIAELTHILLPVLGLACLWLWPGWGGALIWALYFLLGNLPYCLIQRYNRPKYVRLYERLLKRSAATKKTIEQGIGLHNESIDSKLQ